MAMNTTITDLFIEYLPFLLQALRGCVGLLEGRVVLGFRVLGFRGWRFGEDLKGRSGPVWCRLQHVCLLGAGSNTCW